MVNTFVLEARIRRVCEAQPNNVRLRAASTSLTKARSRRRRASSASRAHDAGASGRSRGPNRAPRAPRTRGQPTRSPGAFPPRRTRVTPDPGIMTVAMGKVVELETPRTESREARSRRGRRRRSKTALVLGGGGFTGGVYEIGALRALDLLAVNRTINQFDVYVGTSAGAFVAGMVANGITPEEMMRVVNRELPSPLSRHLARHAAAPQLPRLRAQVDDLPAAGGRCRPRAAQPPRRALRGGRRDGARRAGCRPASTRAPASSATSPRCSPTPTEATTSGCSTASST